MTKRDPIVTPPPELIRWVDAMKAAEVDRYAGLVEDYFGIWAIAWSVSRVDHPTRYQLTAKLIDPATCIAINDWLQLVFIARAFGAPVGDPMANDSGDLPPTTIRWRWCDEVC